MQLHVVDMGLILSENTLIIDVTLVREIPFSFRTTYNVDQIVNRF